MQRASGHWASRHRRAQRIFLQGGLGPRSQNPGRPCAACAADASEATGSQAVVVELRHRTPFARGRLLPRRATGERATEAFHLASAQLELGITTFWIAPSLRVCLLFLLLTLSTDGLSDKKGLFQ